MRLPFRALACALATTSAYAQPAPPTPAAQPDLDAPPSWSPEIVVTAPRPGYGAQAASVTRTDLPLIRTPQSVQALTQTLIREQDLATLADALRNVPGAIPARPSEAVLANPILRGFEAEVFVDGLPAYGDTAVVDPSSLWGVERVEVAKGPASLLFGGGTGAPLGGLINLVTKTPGQELAATGEVRFGSFGLIQPRVDLDLPVAGRVGLRVAAEYTQGGDPVRAADPWRVAVKPSLRFDLGERTTLDTPVHYSRVEQREYAGLPAAIARGLPDVWRFSGATNAPKTTIDNLLVDGVLTHRFSPAVTGTVQLRRYQSRFDEIATFPFLSFFPLQGTAAPIIAGRLPVRLDEWTVDASLSADVRTGPIEHRLLGGVLRDRTDYRGAIGFSFKPLGVLDYADPRSDVAFTTAPPVSPVSNDYRTTALYVQDAASWGRLTVQGGLRYSIYTLNELTGGAGTTQDYRELDPRIGAAWEFTDGVSAFAAYSEGSRLTVFFGGSDPPVPERSRSVEGGFKFAAKRLGLSGTIAGFMIVRLNVPTADPLNPFNSVQTGEQRSSGLEADLVWEPTTALSILATYAFTDAAITRDNTLPVGDRLPRVPEHAGRVAARYRVLSGPLKGFGVGAGVTAATAAELTLPNSLRGDGAAVLDAQASYERGPWRVSLNVQNLADRRYFLPYQYLGQAVVRPGDPRSAYVTLGARF